jgi:glycosyltransferase involved in cell wall biosynthesis
MRKPTVSIGLPVYNGEAFMERALDSILKQDFEDFELVISDNASTDGTGGICETYARGDKRIRYFRSETNCGVNPNHDRVFELSEGEYFMWAAHDVEWLAGLLRRCVQVMQGAPTSVVLVYPRCEVVQNGQILPFDERSSIESKDRRSYRRLETVVRHVYMVNQLYGLMKADALRKTRLNGCYASSDFVLLAELAMLGEIWEIPEVLLRRRIDSDRGTAAVCHDRQAWQAWLNPKGGSAKDAWLQYRGRLALEYVRAAWHVPLKPSEKVMCLLIAPVLPYWRTLLRVSGPWRHTFRRLLGRRTA